MVLKYIVFYNYFKKEVHLLRTPKKMLFDWYRRNLVRGSKIQTLFVSLKLFHLFFLLTIAAHYLDKNAPIKIE